MRNTIQGAKLTSLLPHQVHFAHVSSSAGYVKKLTLLFEVQLFWNPVKYWNSSDRPLESLIPSAPLLQYINDTFGE